VVGVVRQGQAHGLPRPDRDCVIDRCQRRNRCTGNGLAMDQGKKTPHRL
jgi:hypothetical protein